MDNRHVCRDKSHLDFNKLDNLMHQFKGSSSRYHENCVKFLLLFFFSLYMEKRGNILQQFCYENYVSLGILFKLFRLLNHFFPFIFNSIGATKMKAECTQFREYCSAGNGEGYIIISLYSQNTFGANGNKISFLKIWFFFFHYLRMSFVIIQL